MNASLGKKRMAAKVIDGKGIASKIKEELRAKVAKIKEKPCLAIVMVGKNPASEIYVSGKEKACGEVGIGCRRVCLSETISESNLLDSINKLNNDPKVHGILVQLPLPEQIDEDLIINAIFPDKDVDGFSPLHMGSLAIGKPHFIPATALGALKLIESTGIPIAGKHAVVVGRSNIVGKPAALLLLEKNATVTVCHSKTRGLKEYTKEADILVVAIGKANSVSGSMIKKGAVVIDIGINRLPGGAIVGDVEFDSASKVAGWITPVPGGVGPMTIACLLQNVLKAYEGSEAAKKLSSEKKK